MLEYLNHRFRVIERRPPSANGLRKLRSERPIGDEIIELYGEVGEVDIQGPNPRYFRFWTAEEVLEIDSAYGVSTALPGTLPVGSDGGGKLILIREGRVYSASYGALAEQSLRLLANSLREFLENPEPLWPWIEDDPTAGQ